MQNFIIYGRCSWHSAIAYDERIFSFSSGRTYFKFGSLIKIKWKTDAHIHSSMTTART